MEPAIRIPVSTLAHLLRLAAEWEEVCSSDSMDRAALAALAIRHNVPLTPRTLLDLEGAFVANLLSDDGGARTELAAAYRQRMQDAEIAGAELSNQAARLASGGHEAEGEYEPHAAVEDLDGQDGDDDAEDPNPDNKPEPLGTEFDDPSDACIGPENP